MELDIEVRGRAPLQVQLQLDSDVEEVAREVVRRAGLDEQQLSVLQPLTDEIRRNALELARAEVEALRAERSELLQSLVEAEELVLAMEGRAEAGSSEAMNATALTGRYVLGTTSCLGHESRLS